MDSTQIVTIDPSKELTFQQQRDGSLKAYLTIANVSQKNLAYKVKTTAPRYYVVKPNQGILEKGQKINIDITLIQAEENKVATNKFLVQVAPCQLNASETYALQTFWDKVNSSESISFKLKVSVAQGGATVTPQGGSPGGFEGRESFSGTQTRDEGRKSEIAPQPQQQQARLSQATVPQKQEFEKAPDDEINQSRSSVLNQSTTNQPAAQQNVNPEVIKNKVDELKKRYDQVQADKQRLQKDIKELQSSQGDSGDAAKDYAWQQAAQDGKSEGGPRFQLIHLLLVSLACLFLGAILGGKSHHSPGVVSETSTEPAI